MNKKVDNLFDDSLQVNSEEPKHNFHKRIVRMRAYLKPDKEGNVLPVAIDQFPSKDFNKNSYGWPANDITLLQRATTQAEYDLIASRLQEVKRENPNFEGKDDSYIIKTIWPRATQCPSEIDAFMQYYNTVVPADFKINNTSEIVTDSSVDQISTDNVE